MDIAIGKIGQWVRHFMYISAILNKGFSDDVLVNMITAAWCGVQKCRWPLGSASTIPGMERSKCKMFGLEN